MKIGEALLKAGLITEETLNLALESQKKTTDRLGDILLRMGFITPEEIAPFLARYFSLSFVKLRDIYKDIKPEIIDSLSLELAKRFTVIPLEIQNNEMTIAMFDPLDLVAIDTIRIKTGYTLKPVIAIEGEIIEAIEYCYHSLPRLKESVENFIDMEVQDTEKEAEKQEQQFAVGDQPVVQYVKSLVVQAVNSSASDILLRPKQHSAEVRFRIDGVLHNIEPPPKAMLSAINARVKILSGLDIAERRLPQDGRFRVKIANASIDIRTSIFPTLHGESVAMRLLNTSQALLGLEHLGFEASDLEKYRGLLRRPYGLILVTGPTGNGKTTTLYTSLNDIKSLEKNIVTLEDPIEYQLPFILQSQVNPLIGFNFARGLRSLLRHDPDIIMVGEIRDRETAEIAIHAALTGHLVLSTFHTNDAAGAPVRLINMGIEPYLIISSLLGVVAQRLVRTICPDCKKVYQINQGSWEKVPLSGQLTHFARGQGCSKCFKTGYKGRTGIFEILVVDEQINQCISQRSSSEAIRKIAQSAGMKTLYEAGLEKAKAEITTPEEILRVTQTKEEK